MNADEIINIVKESILSEIQNNPVIIQYVKEVSLVQSNIHIHYEMEQRARFSISLS